MGCPGGSESPKTFTSLPMVALACQTLPSSPKDSLPLYVARATAKDECAGIWVCG